MGRGTGSAAAVELEAVLQWKQAGRAAEALRGGRSCRAGRSLQVEVMHANERSKEPMDDLVATAAASGDSSGQRCVLL